MVCTFRDNSTKLLLTPCEECVCSYCFVLIRTEAVRSGVSSLLGCHSDVVYVGAVHGGRHRVGECSCGAERNSNRHFAQGELTVVN